MVMHKSNSKLNLVILLRNYFVLWIFVTSKNKNRFSILHNVYNDRSGIV